MGFYQQMVLIREFEEGVKFLFLEGAMPGTIHQCQGQEATAVGVCAGIDAGRFHHVHVSRPWPCLRQGLRERVTLRAIRRRYRLLPRQGRSMHVGNIDKGMVPGIAIVAGGIPLAAGMALALQDAEKPKQVVACFFGDGAVAEGAFHEGINLAAIWDCPRIFVCENNLYGASTRIDSRHAEPADRRPIAPRLRHQGRASRRQRCPGRITRPPERAADRCRAARAGTA